MSDKRTTPTDHPTKPSSDPDTALVNDQPSGEAAEAEAAVTDDAAAASPGSDGPDGGDGLSPLERLQAEKDQLTDRLARTQAEFANYRKRIARDQAQFQDRAKATVLEAFIPALDALDSAAGHDVGLIAPVRKVIAETAERIGLERFEPELGDRFDPTHHEAVATPDVDDEAELVVSCVVRPGYRIGTRLLRAAEVTLDAAAGEGADDPGTDSEHGTDPSDRS